MFNETYYTGAVFQRHERHEEGFLSYGSNTYEMTERSKLFSSPLTFAAASPSGIPFDDGGRLPAGRQVLLRQGARRAVDNVTLGEGSASLSACAVVNGRASISSTSKPPHRQEEGDGTTIEYESGGGVEPMDDPTPSDAGGRMSRTPKR
jgi:hypothetical protein